LGGTTLAPGEILKAITFPGLTHFSGVAFEKFRYRLFDAAIVSVCCALVVDDHGAISEARISVGAVKKAPQLALGATAGLIGARRSEISLDTLGGTVADEILP